MRTLLIGAEGQLGTDVRALWPHELIGRDWPELDVRDAAQVGAVVADVRPEVIVNCAAMTNVDQCEDEPDAAFAVNTQGALHVARAAAEHGAAVVYISTDYVFGAAGVDAAPYMESSVPGPLGVYGVSKLAGEHVTLAYDPAALVVRTCGLYGHAGARGKGGNFVETMLKLGGDGRALRVVDDQRLSPTSTVACARVLRDLIDKQARGVVHVTAADHCTWYAFAREIFNAAEIAADLSPIPSSEYPQKARRPAMSVLASERLSELGIAGCPDWATMLHEYLEVRTARHAG
jgi:dTDP-4-dehydrorhamnose reductase